MGWLVITGGMGGTFFEIPVTLIGISYSLYYSSVHIIIILLGGFLIEI